VGRAGPEVSGSAAFPAGHLDCGGLADFNTTEPNYHDPKVMTLMLCYPAVVQQQLSQRSEA
jgi:hypothetical protein